jgi:Flp pilus assembly protein TadD
VRVRRLHALDHEARGDYKDAVDIYDEILRGDPVNSYCLKRKAAVLRSLGRLEEARKQLNDYVQVYSSDAAAWQELCELYIVEESLELARFCAEELVLLEPANFFYHLQLAEILYALGGKNNYADARRYYAQSLELKVRVRLRVCSFARCPSSPRPTPSPPATCAPSSASGSACAPSPPPSRSPSSCARGPRSASWTRTRRRRRRRRSPW